MSCDDLGDTRTSAIQVELVTAVHLLLSHVGIEVQVTELDLIDLPIPLSNLIDIGGLVLGGPHLNINGDIVADAMLIVEVSFGYPGGEAC